MTSNFFSKLFKACAIIFMIVMIFNKSYSQSKDSLREEFTNELLSDTLVGFGDLLPLKIKLKGNDTIRIWCGQTQYLFEYYHEKYQWDGNTFIQKFKPYLLNEKAWEIDSVDAKYFLAYTNNPLPEIKCKCIFNEDESELLDLVKKGYVPKGNSGEFACLIYNCSKKYLLVSIGEDDHLSIEPFTLPRLILNDFDGTPR